MLLVPVISKIPRTTKSLLLVNRLNIHFYLIELKIIKLRESLLKEKTKEGKIYIDICLLKVKKNVWQVYAVLS